MHLRVSRAAVADKDASIPGYRADIEAIATGGDETHYHVPGDAHRQVVRKYARPRTSVTVNRRKRFALGDAVESMLTAVGITKERVQWLTRTKDCGCAARARWLNRWGFEKQAQLERIVQKAAKWYGIS
jgi:hypothetical protein